MPDGVGLISTNYEVLEDFNGDSSSGLHQGCPLVAVVVVGHDEPEQLLSLREEHEA